MAWVVNDGTYNTYNMACEYGYQAMFRFKALLKSIGWTVQMSGDGLAVYSAVGDIITQNGTGANGMGNNNAWFRIQDPGARREYLFQHASSGYSWKVIYSALDKFTGGAPAFGTLPTATDQQGVRNGALTAGGLFSSTTTRGYSVHMAAQSVPTGDVYPFWLTSQVTGVYSNAPSMLGCEALDPATTAAADADPCVHIATDTCNAVQMGQGSNYWMGWHRMNLTEEEWGPLPISNNSLMTLQVGNNPHDGSWLLMEPLVHRIASGWLVRGFKGAMQNYKQVTAPLKQLFGTIINQGGQIYFSSGAMLLPGWPSVSIQAMR